MKFDTERFIIGFFIILCVALIGLVAYSTYGRATQENVVTFVVTNKDIDSGTTCVSNGKTVSCVPYTHHRVYDNDSKYLIDPELYDQVIIGKRHSFHTVGWEWDMYIDEVLE